MNDRSPAQVYALVVGGTLVVAGIIGFFYSTAFDSPGKVKDVFGVLSVNGWHNVVHVATGALGLVSLGYAAARSYALLLGVIYAVVAVVIRGCRHIAAEAKINTDEAAVPAVEPVPECI